LSRDPLFGERIVWTASPTVLAPPPLARAAGFVFFVLSAISICFAIVIALAFSAPTGLIAATVRTLSPIVALFYLAAIAERAWLFYRA